MPKQINFTYDSPSSIDNAIKEIRDYQNSLERKCEILVDRISDIGLQCVKAVLSRHRSGSGATIGSARIEFSTQGSIKSASIVVESDAILFLEFGSGIKYNQSEAHPKASELGYGVGTYPNQTHAFDENGWWYQDDDGVWKHSYGIKADMPMYKGAMKMHNELVRVAKEVFTS